MNQRNLIIEMNTKFLNLCFCVLLINSICDGHFNLYLTHAEFRRILGKRKYNLIRIINDRF